METRTRARVWSLAVALCVLAGCGDDDGVAPGSDAGSGGTDAGGATSDAGPRTDAGGAPTDAGSTGTDAGGVETDAGATGTDAGVTGTDAGDPGIDAGSSATDAGPPAVDAAICAATPTPMYVMCIASSLGVRFTTGGVEQLWYTSRVSGTALPACGAPSGYSLVSDADLARGRVNLPGGPGLGECWTYRLCARDSRCTDEWSDGLDVEFCVDGSGTMPTCSMR